VCSRLNQLLVQPAAHFDPGTKALKMDKICPDFIISSFKDACAVKKFHGKWMTADTWAKVIARYFKLSDIFKFNGNQLIHHWHLS